MKKLTLIFIVITNTLVAQENIVTDRPDATESSLTIPFKSIQFETGITYASEQNNKSYTLPEYLLRIGIHEFLELRLENSYYERIVLSGYGFSDILLGVKAQALKKEKFDIAFLSHINLPEEDRSELFFVEKLLLSYKINETTELGVNLGIDGFNGSNNGEFVYAIALGKGMTDKFGFFLENYGSVSKSNGLNSVVDGGFSYLLKNKIQLDTKVGIDTQFFKDYFFGAGVSVRIFK